MIFDDEIEKSLAGLKDFQRATVDYAFQKYVGGKKRYLIADEVGLGKTIVARGIIAKLYQKYHRKNKDFVVVYICSNRALAKQNINKLSFSEESDEIIDFKEDNDRLSDLAFEDSISKSNKYNFKIKAFTPATSFDNRTRAGKQKERILLYRLLIDEFRDRRVSLMWFLKGGNRIENENWKTRIEKAEQDEKKQTNPIRHGLKEKFIKRIKQHLEISSKAYQYLEQGDKSLYDILLRILEPRKKHISFTKEGYSYNTWNTPLIAELRYYLNDVCADYLDADLFVLDEFQRFSTLIQDKEITGNDPGTEIAQRIFEKKDSKILLLSATPFKAYTNYINELDGENHYTEFRKVLRFLLHKQDDKFWTDLDLINHSFFSALHHLSEENFDQNNILDIKSEIEGIYRNAISRTERTLVENENVMESGIQKPLKVDTEDIIDFVVFDRIVQEINNSSLKTRSLPVPIEYVKSSPFPLSFLQDYEHLRVIEQELKENKDLEKLIQETTRAFVEKDIINNFDALLPEKFKSVVPNPKLRLLYEETVKNGGWQLLWIPPTIEYYYPGKNSPFVVARGFTKTLIFSAWKMVPRMVSALVSYEAERYSIGKFLKDKEDAKIEYFSTRRLPRPRLVFAKGLKNMNNFLLTYPSVFLAELYDPKQNLLEKKSLKQIKQQLKESIRTRLLELGVLNIKTEEQSGDWQKWNWFALFLLDRSVEGNKAFDAWKIKRFEDTSSFESDDEKKDNERGGKQEHFNEMLKCLSDKSYFPNLNKLSSAVLDRVCNFLAELTIGSPAIASLRTLDQLFPTTDSLNLQCAYNIGMAFTSLFNKPESIAIIDMKIDENENYYSNVIKYCIAGNIQSMLDEFLFQIKDSGNIKSNKDIADELCSILAVNTSSQDIKTKESLIKGEANLKIRTHYALPFGIGNNSDLKVGNRQIKVREAFNSPFRPFVLTSTSIGQEGLDFHYYCSKLIHWNLPSNPIDLEQREGRLKRYKSLAIRRTLVQKYKDDINSIENVWEEIYKIATKNKDADTCDLVPFWYSGKESNIKTIIPLYPFSKDGNRLDYIKNVLANYRLTFGQPRQEDLVSVLSHLDIDNVDLEQLTINLSPIKY
ncbi:DEAD/DEAH box helicase family protein [Dysgonomonas capnocytophagoides]|uniref:DEAD/DEAH box helicase family protein n=1 Tax=Dysgonomonas capnocytophagoides TaxID=45254 RepID=UPI0039968E50